MGECTGLRLGEVSYLAVFLNVKIGQGLAATFDLAAFLVSMFAPVKKSVNHLRTAVSMRKTQL